MRTALWLGVFLAPFVLDVFRFLIGSRPATQLEFQLHFAIALGSGIFLYLHWLASVLGLIRSRRRKPHDDL